MPDGITVLAIATAIACGLVGGFFYAFSSFVMPALGAVPAPAGIASMQSINVKAVAPAPMLAMFGTAVLCVATIVAGLAELGEAHGALLLIGGVLYLAGTIGVTMFANVPLNNALEAEDPASDSGARLWRRYLGSWTAWNTVRTIAALAAATALTVALVV
ncbi:MAG TPA: anthrone oxygenase family protein [Solirubrobacterales bacterium]|nr:anthrone oxygenase family protein [Solirubrobacterales bacterium]